MTLSTKEAVAMADGNKPFLALLWRRLNMFMTSWYPLPSNTTLMFASTEDPLHASWNGFVAQRRKVLYKALPDDTSFEFLSVPQRIKIIEYAAYDPYTPQNAPINDEALLSYQPNSNSVPDISTSASPNCRQSIYQYRSMLYTQSRRSILQTKQSQC